MADTGGPCPNCRRPTDAKSRCWKCHERRCERCGLATGSAFIRMCIACGKAEGDERVSVPDGPSEPPRPAKRWILVLEAKTDTVPTSVRVKRVIKYAMKMHDLHVVAMPSELPDGARTDQVEEA